MKDKNSEPFGRSSDQVPEEGKSFVSPVISVLLPGEKIYVQYGYNEAYLIVRQNKVAYQ